MKPVLSCNPLRHWSMIMSTMLVVILTAAVVLADANEDFNSPTPVLISEKGSTRALIVNADDFNGTIPERSSASAFNPGSKSRVVFFVTNLSLLDGEGANAFRMYLENAGGKVYRIHVEDLRPISKDRSVYAVTAVLYDANAYNGQMEASGDHLVRLTWRGLSSNRVRMGIGKAGGEIKDDARAIPTSYPVSSKTAKEVEDIVTAEYAGFKYKGDRTRFMQQAAFGPSPALNDRLRRIGIRTWLAEQLEATGPTVPYPNLPLMHPTNDNLPGPSCAESLIVPPYTRDLCLRDHYNGLYQVQTWFYKDAFYGENQLLRRTSWALHQIWVVAHPDVQMPAYMMQYQRLLDRHAFGNYRQLMQEMTLHPSMGRYLDMMGSTRNNPNENYAREILQLFTIGLFMQNQDGSLQLDGQGNPIPTYTQDTVNNFTEVFTGWQACQQPAPTCPNFVASGVPNYIDPMLLNQNLHNVTTKTLLSYPGAPNVNLPANQNGMTDLTQALDNIYAHPNVAPFVSKLLIQHLVTSDPTPAYISRVAAVFNSDGEGNRGNMKAVLRAILLDPEARGDVKTDPNYGKLREPTQLLTNVARNFNVRSANGTLPSDGNVNSRLVSIGQDAFRPPSVFNYYSAEYVVPGTDVLGPEFAILNTGSAIARANLFNTLIFSGFPVSGNDTPNGTSLDLSGLQALATADPTCNQLLDELNNKMLGGSMSADMRSRIMTATLAVPSTNPLARARQALYLVATSSQFQVQR